MRPRLLSVLLSTAAVAAVACSGASPNVEPVGAVDPAPAAVQQHRIDTLRAVAPGPAPAIIADARHSVSEVPAFRRPSSKRPFVVFDNPDRYLARRVFLVDETRPGWVRAYLPMRPNGTRGWIRARDLKLRETNYRIKIDLSSNRLSVFEGDEVVMRESVAAGTGGTPTPTGLFYGNILVETGDPGSAYGPYILGLSGYSEVLFSFAGGDGQVGIHGTNNPSLIGQDVSNGCIRMRNPAITKLVKMVPVGVPVRIVA